jgi:hypothetical protein
MSLVWRGFMSGVQRRGRRWARPLRRALTVLLGTGGFAVAAAGAAQTSAGPQHALVAVGWQVWRAPEHGLPDALRLRRVSRLVGLRTAFSLGLGAAIGLALDNGLHGRPVHSAGVVALWLAVATPVPVLAETVLWRFAPRQLRLSVRTARLAEEVQSLNAKLTIRPALVFDPDLGRTGRVRPIWPIDPVPDEYGAQAQVRPVRREAWLARPEGVFGAQEEDWLRSASLGWNGQELLLTDGTGKVLRIPLRPDAVEPSPLADRPVELIVLRELPYGGVEYELRILLLDASGRCLLTMPGLGIRPGDLKELAAAARLQFSYYILRTPVWEIPRLGFVARMFPRHRRHVRLRLGRHHWSLMPAPEGSPGTTDRGRI